MSRSGWDSVLAAALLIAAAGMLAQESPPPSLERAAVAPAPTDKVARIATPLDAQSLAHELADAYAAAVRPLTPEITLMDSAQVADAVLTSQADLGIVLLSIQPSKAFNPPPAWGEAEAILIGWEAVVLVTHPLRQMPGLDSDTVAQVLSGEIQTWEELGSGQGSIELLGRGEGAPSREALMGSLSLDSLSSRLELWPNDAEICRQVASRPLSLGWIGQSALTDRCHPLSLDSIQPTAQAVQTGAYGARLAVVMVVGPHAPPEARALARWAASAPGQRVVGRRYTPAS